MTEEQDRIMRRARALIVKGWVQKALAINALRRQAGIFSRLRSYTPKHWTLATQADLDGLGNFLDLLVEQLDAGGQVSLVPAKEEDSNGE